MKNYQDINRVIILENGCEQEIPTGLLRKLNCEGKEWDHFHMGERFWPENREETFNFFRNLPDGKEIYLETVFEDYIQLEMMIELLYKLKDKNFTVKIRKYNLAYDLLDFYQEEYSSIMSKEMEDELYNSLGEEFDRLNLQAKEFKENIKSKFIDVLNFHTLFWIHPYEGETILKSLEDIQQAHETWGTE